MGRQRFILLVCFLVVVAAVAAAAWTAGSRIVTPAEAAARTAPPSPSAILVPIEKRVLSSTVVTRGTARFGLPQSIGLAPSTLKTGPSVITTLPIRNAQFKEGDVLFTASGRPVFVLQGQIPAYRDLVPGHSGKDVRQIEEALQRLGFDTGAVDGRFDEALATAVAAWYESAGWEPFWPTAAQNATIRTLEQELSDATRSNLAASAASASAARAVEAARAKSEHANKAATAEIAAGIAARALVAVDPRALQTARSSADAQLEVAPRAQRSAKLEGEVNIQAAIDAQKVAELDAKLAAVRVDRLSTEVEAGKRKLGVQLPVDEYVFIPSLPVRAHETTLRVGDQATGPVLAVTNNQIVIDSSLPLAAAPLIKPGMEVSIDEQALGIKAKGIVEQVATNPGTHGTDGFHIYFEVRVVEMSTSLEGFSLRLTIPVTSTKGAVIAVPLSALTQSPDGTSRVQVEKNGNFEYIKVEPGLSAGGFVEVIPVDGTLEPGQLVVVSDK